MATAALGAEMQQPANAGIRGVIYSWPGMTLWLPAFLARTGDPIFCSRWTLCGMPPVSVPPMQGAPGRPLGVQLVGARDRDGQLLRTARWLAAHVGAG